MHSEQSPGSLMNKCKQTWCSGRSAYEENTKEKGDDSVSELVMDKCSASPPYGSGKNTSKFLLTQPTSS